MTTFKVTFKNDEGKTTTITVKHTGIVPALEDAIRKQFCKVTKFNQSFWRPIKVEEIEKTKVSA